MDGQEREDVAARGDGQENSGLGRFRGSSASKH